VVICLERGADLRVAQLMPLPLTDSRFSKIQIGFTFLIPAYVGSPGKRAIKLVCVCCLSCLHLSSFQSLVALWTAILLYCLLVGNKGHKVSVLYAGICFEFVYGIIYVI